MKVMLLVKILSDFQYNGMIILEFLVNNSLTRIWTKEDAPIWIEEYNDEK
jgi:hypothetical protein